jgi:hypothetical protein
VQYQDGTLIEPGDIVQIDTVYKGRVIACMDTDKYLPGEEGWSYLGKGIMIDTDFGGLVHYMPDTAESDQLLLIRREPVKN